jgi:uncharacterized membrane protein YjjB (DUF3815 family)
MDVLKIIMIGFGTGFVSIALSASKDDLPINALLGSICFATYLYVIEITNNSLLATFLASFLISFLSIYLTRKRGKPLQIYLIAGIIPLLPGLNIFKMVFGFVNQDNTAILENANLTIQILAIIVISIVFASSITKLLKRLKFNIKKPES